MLTIAPYSAWCKGNVAQNNDNFTEATDGENLLHEARVVEVSMHFSSSRKPANANVQKHPKRSTRVYILTYKRKRAKQLSCCLKTQL